MTTPTVLATSTRFRVLMPGLIMLVAIVICILVINRIHPLTRACDHTKLRVDMTESELVQICGEPTEKYQNKTVVVLGGKERLPDLDVQYRYWGNSVIVFVRDGKVRSWQYIRQS
jgi:hypothetical protein